MNRELLGKWVEGADQTYPGLYFQFFEDGTYQAIYEALGVTSGGTWSSEGDLVYMDQTSHTFGMVGKYHGRYAIDGEKLRMHLVAEGEHALPADLSAAVIYDKTEE